jgi:hypothetical protein
MGDEKRDNKDQTRLTSKQRRFDLQTLLLHTNKEHRYAND